VEVLLSIVLLHVQRRLRPRPFVERHVGVGSSDRRPAHDGNKISSP
jgi:hypothetical protein